MKQLLEQIAKALVDLPDEVKIEEGIYGGTVIFALHVAEGEVGKVIGKKGITATAIRQILESVANKLGQRVVLEIIE